jgi:hypothetical protein
MSNKPLYRLLKIWVVIAVVDFCFASALSIFAYDSTFARLWQGVASTVLGPEALTGGTRTVVYGLVLHVGVALAWSTVFLALHTALPALRRLTATPGGILLAATAYGPVVWIAMSMLIIPMMTGRPPTITIRWWIQIVGHIGFVALPIVAMTARDHE